MAVRQFRVYSLFLEGKEKRWRPLAATVTLEEAKEYVVANGFDNFQIVEIATREVKEICENGRTAWPRDAFNEAAR